jgi:hypothetical protein
MLGGATSPQNDARALRIMLEGEADMQLHRFPFLTFVSMSESFSVSNGLTTAAINCVCYQGLIAGTPPAAAEGTTFRNFLRFFRTVSSQQRYDILHIHETLLYHTMVTFHELDSIYAVTILYHGGCLAIVLKLRDYDLRPLGELLRNRTGLEFKMRGTYFKQDEADTSDIAKRDRLTSLSLPF